MPPIPTRPDPIEKRLVRLMLIAAIVGTMASLILPFIL